MEKCKHMKRQQCMSKNWIYSWQWKSSKTRQQFCRLESFAMKTDIPMNGSMVKNHISLKYGIRIQCDTENFVPIVVPDLSASSSSGSYQSTSRTLSRQESHCSTSSSSSSSSPTVTSSGNETREQGSNWKWHLQWLSQLRLTIDRSNPLCTKPIKSQKPIKRSHKKIGATSCVLKSGSGCKNSEKFWRMMNFLTRRLTRQFFSWSVFRAHIQETWGFGYAQCLHLFP